jgi:hypothetical protein
MTTADRWIGGAGNQASDAADWSTGVPVAGDILIACGPGMNGPSESYVMNVQGNQLAGDSITSGDCTLTINASRQAVLYSEDSYRSGVTFNLSQQSTLYLTADYEGGMTVNLTGTDILIINGTGGGAPVINLSAGSEWVGTFSLDYTNITASASASFDNDGASRVFDGGPGPGQVVLPVNVIGNGSFDVATSYAAGAPTRLEFMKAVGSQQSVTDRGLVIIDNPHAFAASITLEAANPGEIPFGTVLPSEIDLVGLVSANSYTFKADMLRIYAGTQVIDTLRLTDQTAYGFEVEKISAGVGVISYADASRTNVGTALPVHVG